ncbi:unnamed protein product, partial [Sphacelaria rigidula]
MSQGPGPHQRLCFRQDPPNLPQQDVDSSGIGETVGGSGSGSGGSTGGKGGWLEARLARMRRNDEADWKAWKHRLEGETAEKPREVAGPSLPFGFVPRLAHRALGAYALIRTFSRPFRLAPCTSVAFLRAMTLQLRNPLLDAVHCELLKRVSCSLKGRVGGWCKGREAQRELDWRCLDQVTWPAYFVELVRAVEEHRRREEEKALAELEGESDGMLSGEESDEGSDAGSKSAADGQGRDGEGAKWGGGDDGRSDRSKGDKSDGEEDGVERDPLEIMASAFESGEYHLLPLDIKVQALEYLVDLAMECPWFEKEIEYRLRSPPENFVVDEDGTVFDCIICGVGGNLVCCDNCPRAYHTKCIGGKHGIETDNWSCWECRVPDSAPDGIRIPRVTTPLGPVWVIGGFVFRTAPPPDKRKPWAVAVQEAEVAEAAAAEEAAEAAANVGVSDAGASDPGDAAGTSSVADQTLAVPGEGSSSRKSNGPSTARGKESAAAAEAAETMSKASDKCDSDDDSISGSRATNGTRGERDSAGEESSTPTDPDEAMLMAARVATSKGAKASAEAEAIAAARMASEAHPSDDEEGEATTAATVVSDKEDEANAQKNVASTEGVSSGAKTGPAGEGEVDVAQESEQAEADAEKVADEKNDAEARAQAQAEAEAQAEADARAAAKIAEEIRAKEVAEARKAAMEARAKAAAIDEAAAQARSAADNDPLLYVNRYGKAIPYPGMPVHKDAGSPFGNGVGDELCRWEAWPLAETPAAGGGGGNGGSGSGSGSRSRPSGQRRLLPEDPEECPAEAERSAKHAHLEPVVELLLRMMDSFGGLLSGTQWKQGWGIGGQWPVDVRAADSVHQLARLTTELVDALPVRAFRESWRTPYELKLSRAYRVEV